MKKNKPKLIYFTLAVCVLIIISVALVTKNKKESVTLREDVNNSCSENGLTSGVARKLE